MNELFPIIAVDRSLWLSSRSGIAGRVRRYTDSRCPSFFDAGPTDLSIRSAFAGVRRAGILPFRASTSNLGTFLGEIGHDLRSNNPGAAGYEDGHGDAPCDLKNGSGSESVPTRTRRVAPSNLDMSDSYSGADFQQQASSSKRRRT